ncbi:hypothetical protein BJ170DRAFT_722113 [Xylariales sp. AK1849]|nr:hypothetical protein BJ170DRAFT_722113 [Xylariales sp. AK1849]
MLFIPESPRWVILQSKIDAGRKSLTWLRPKCRPIEMKIAEIRTAIDRNREIGDSVGVLDMFNDLVDRRRMGLSVAGVLLEASSRINVYHWVWYQPTLGSREARYHYSRRTLSTRIPSTEVQDMAIFGSLPWCILVAEWDHLFLPKAKGRTLEEIDEMVCLDKSGVTNMTPYFHGVAHSLLRSATLTRRSPILDKQHSTQTSQSTSLNETGISKGDHFISCRGPVPCGDKRAASREACFFELVLSLTSCDASNPAQAVPTMATSRDLFQKLYMLLSRDGSIPSQCYNDCMNVYLKAQAVGKSSALCATDSTFSFEYVACSTCLRASPTSSVSITATITILRQLAKLCETQTPTPTSVIPITPSSASASAATSTEIPFDEAEADKVWLAGPLVGGVVGALVTFVLVLWLCVRRRGRRGIRSGQELEGDTIVNPTELLMTRTGQTHPSCQHSSLK